MSEQVYLVVPQKSLSSYLRETDRAYFAKPVPVTPLWCDVLTRHVYVRDEQRGVQFPALVRDLKTRWQLTHRQRQQIG